MHPETARGLAEARRAELAGEMRSARLRSRLRGGGGPGEGGRERREGRRPGPGAVGRAVPGVFLAEPEAFGFRAYLTPEEAGRLADGWSRMVARYAGRLGDPARRPAGAQPVEVVVMARRLPEREPACGSPGRGTQ